MNYMKQYVVISGLGLQDNNRGTAALGYGAFTFLQERGFLKEGHRLIKLVSTGNPLKPYHKAINKTERFVVNGHEWIQDTITIKFYIWKFFKITGIVLPFTNLRRLLKDIDWVAAINGGDGFSDIYNSQTFYGRLPESMMAIKANIPLIILPQTLGPFENRENYVLAQRILKYASHVYIRDNEFIAELMKMGVKYELTNDLSSFMKAEPWDIEIVSSNSIGVNVSGLAYSNSFRSLSGQFDSYPELINQLIMLFQKKGKIVYLIPHSYRFGNPENGNDDLQACQLAYNRLADKSHVILIDKDLTSPQVKYLISKMTFFVGTRMHANFAAIFSKVPLYGLAYSYKFQGAFERNGIYNRTTMINNIKPNQIPSIIDQIYNAYVEDTQKNINNE